MTRLSDEVERILQAAEVEARGFGANCVCTEHILLGMLLNRSTAAASALRSVGVNLKDARYEVTLLSKPQEDSTGRLMPGSTFNMSNGTQLLLEKTAWEAKFAKSHTADSMQLLIALLQLGECGAVTVMEKLGVGIDLFRVRISKPIKDVLLPVEVINSPIKRPTRRCLRAVALAIVEARRYGLNTFSTEHMLLGLIDARGGMAAAILDSHHVTHQRARVVLEEMAPFVVPAHKRPARGEVDPTPELNCCFLAASNLAEKSGLVDTEHLLLAILDRPGKALDILEAMHVDVDSITSDLRNALQPFGD